MGVGLGIGDVGAAGDEVADPGAQLLVEVEFAVLVAGEVLPVEGLPALGGLLRAELPAGQGAGPLPGGGVGGGAVVDEDSVDVEQDGADGGARADPGESQVVTLTGGGGSWAGVGPVERSPTGSGRDRAPGWRRGRPAATSPLSPMGVAGFFSGRSRGCCTLESGAPAG